MFLKIAGKGNVMPGMRRGLLAFILSCSALFSFGQLTIKGKIINAGQDLPAVTVSLLRTDSSLIRTVITDSLGLFAFTGVTPGNYLVSSSAVGYARFCTPVILVKDKDITLPDIVLRQLSGELSEVVIKSKKSFYEQKIDRLVVNVQASITSAGNTVLEVLEKSPGIVVNRQNSTISMNGRAGVRIMINDKLLQLPTDAAVQLLDGMSSANVEKIELIAVPPSKYDAEGNAGIIHIVMKASPDLGTKGSFGLTLGYRWAENLGTDFNLNHRSKRFSFFLDYSLLRNHNLHVFEMTRQLPENNFTQVVNDFSRRENVTIQQNLNTGIEWSINNSTELSLSITAYRSNWDLAALGTEKNLRTADSTAITNMKIHESNIWQSITAGIGLQKKISTRHTLNLGLDYLYYHNSNPSVYNNTVFYNQSNTSEYSIIDLQKITPIKFYIVTANYQYSVSPSLEFETGAKGVTSSLSNDVFVRRYFNNAWVIDSFFSSSSKLNEQAAAMYVSAKWKAGNEWQLNGGLRYEYTYSSISTPAIKNLISRRYGYFFPSVYVRKELKNGKDFQFSYSKRITRPTYNDIAPWVFFWDPGTFSAGNTSLLPSISHSIKADFHNKQWIVSIQFSHSKNEISFLQPEIDTQSNYLIYRSQNMKYLNTIGLANSFSFRITHWWQLQTNITGQYQIVQTRHLQNNKAIHIYGLNAFLTNSFSLPKEFSAEVSGTFQSKSFWGISYLFPYGSLNAAIKKRIGEKGTLRFALDDILNTSNWKFKTYLPENKLDAYFFYRFHNQYIRISYTRNFGNSKLKSIQKKSGSEEEKKRVSN
jgi:hypothetical protein